ncbi:glutamic acid-rich protein-like isoform X2 [Sinocyclocheilus rhinocerous]|uniref:glutamic acid-rich protein-like isoform X2 n=1 Tax=Sinocyclocheilus rhinocerous TaxID=307959 RepID=UPI0007B81CD4|nr:PREDICTED: glutamic acid-rich protein-like isoform X2 [Sinocyclocheilus rhinocerous]
MTSFTKGEEERHDNHQSKAYENLQHKSRAAWLQDRWLEISEQERRAQIKNQKLLQDFQRAQDTLNDMVARTEAMNTIRVQYKQYLEENFPRWQQRLKDIRVSEKSKHLKSYIQKMEEEEGIKYEHSSDFRAHLLSSNFPDASQPSHTMLNTHQRVQDIKQNPERCNHQPYIPPTWLTGSEPSISGLPQNNIAKDYKNLQNTQALNHPLPPYYSLPGDLVHQSHSPVQQKPPSMDHLWAGIRQGFMPTAHFTPPAASWPRLRVLNPMTWGVMDVPDPSEERIQCSEPDKIKVIKAKPKHRRKGKESDRSSELDCRPVRLSINHEESSEGSAVSSKVTVSGMQKRRKKKTDGTKSNSTENRNESHGSSTMSQDASDSNSGTKMNKKHQKQFNKCNSNESVFTEKTVDAVMQDESEQEESKSQDISQSSVSSDKKDGSEGLNIRQEEDSNEGDDDSHDIIAAEEKISHREDKDEEEDEESTDGDEEAGFDDEAQGGDEEVMGKRDGTEPSNREEPEREGDVPDYIPDMGETTEEEERDNSFQNTKEARKTQETVEDEREIHKSLEESEEEEVYNQETEDDEEEDDEVVVEKAYAWSRDPFDDHTKCPEDDEDDIEGLLNPVKSQTQQEDDMKETDQSNDQPSDSEKDNLPQKSHPAATNEIVESDDGFDHFYD